MVKGKSFSILNLCSFCSWIDYTWYSSSQNAKVYLSNTFSELLTIKFPKVWSEIFGVKILIWQSLELATSIFCVLQKQPFNNHSCNQSCLILIKRKKPINFCLYQFSGPHKMLQRCSYFLGNLHSHMSYT